MARGAIFQVQVDTRAFNRMLGELAAIDPGVEWDTVLTHEVAATTTTALKRTKSATVGKIRKDHRGKQWATIDGKKYNLDWRYGDRTWSKIKARRDRDLADKLAARGLSKHSWLASFQKLGVPPTASIPAFVRRAHTPGRFGYLNNSTIVRQSGGDRAGIELINRAPGINWPAAGMRRALTSAVRGRAAFFRKNMETGFYRTLKTRAAKYPGIFVTR